MAVRMIAGIMGELDKPLETLLRYYKVYSGDSDEEKE